MLKNTLDYSDETKNDIKLLSMFKTIFDFTLTYLKKEGVYHVSLSLVSLRKIHSLNKEYRKIDRPTDVLTFAFDESKDASLPFDDLGCIFISPDIANKQAKLFNHPFNRELAFLFIHGLLHIFGYDHMKEEDAKVMFALQNDILNHLPIDFYTDFKKMKKNLLEARSKAIVPYSHFAVGATCLTKDGKYHQGFNIENASYPATVCAERALLFTCYCEGYKKDDIVSFSIITSGHNLSTCCGVCRQVMLELLNPYTPVYIYNNDFTKELKTRVEELLPYGFTSEDLHS